MADRSSCVVQMGAVAIGGRALAMCGPPGCGKSTLALALIDRGAQLIGDDGITLIAAERSALSGGGEAGELLAAPPPNIAGMMEIAGIGIASMSTAGPTPLALVLDLGRDAERMPDAAERSEWLGSSIPVLPFSPGDIAPAIRAEYALRLHGLTLA